MNSLMNGCTVRVCDIVLLRLQKRYVLEEAERLEPRVSALEEDAGDVESGEEEEEEEEKLERVPSPCHCRRSSRDLEGRIALPHRPTGGVGSGLPEGGVGLPKEVVLHPAEKVIGIRAQDAAEAGPRIHRNHRHRSHSVS
ncbi:pre-mRNA-splicing factor 38A-like [Fukomys damarensis]|uniref:pre-mRNA-splicing factor 38A-like n=1 Tax=Fukomys damarensis TaxID=885580 RepID=UPI0014555A43|nr:pre-mRNA-splicing factor 38A-like [Fukomys damarensis]